VLCEFGCEVHTRYVYLYSKSFYELLLFMIDYPFRWVTEPILTIGCNPFLPGSMQFICKVKIHESTKVNLTFFFTNTVGTTEVLASNHILHFTKNILNTQYYEKKQKQQP